ncbi:MAG: TIGR04086 family membrane protein [Paenibacillaceae bacterium]|nr:TIGR04086 family membrane protein [Paenibacillaceae bacterium]
MTAVFFGIVSTCALTVCTTAMSAAFATHRATPVVWASIVLSAAIGAFVAARLTKRKGWLLGGTIGLVFGALLCVLGMTAYAHDASLHMVVLCAVTSVSGSIGGMIGVSV